MMTRCLTCHVGTRPPAGAAGADCAACHKTQYLQWRGTAHAQTLSHVHIPTVNPVTRQSEPYNFGDLHGMECVACHQLAAAPATAPATGCKHHFVPGSAAESCARCHGSTDAQWRTWLAGPQPSRLDWPPGQVSLQTRGQKTTCVDCHMPLLERDARARDHRWAARREPAFLATGVAVETGDTTNPRASAAPLQFWIANLTGHSFPTGSRRRAIRLEWVSGNSAVRWLDLGPRRPSIFSLDSQPALAPGEQRIVKSARPTGPVDGWRLMFYRNRFDPTAYSTTIVAGAVP
jgi:hypothetical protein